MVVNSGQMIPDDVIEEELNNIAPFENFNQDFLKSNGRGASAITTLVNEELLQQELEAEFTYMIQSDFEFTDVIRESRLMA